MNDSQDHDRSRDRARGDSSSRLADRISEPSRDSHRRRDSRDRHHHSRPESSSRRRERARDRSRERPRSPSGSRHGGKDTEDLIPRFRESKEKERRYDDDRRYSRPSGHDRERHRERRHSPSEFVTKRTRSRTRSPERSHRKKSRRDRSSSRRPRDEEDREARKRRRHSPHDERRSSPRASTRRHRSIERSERHRSSRRERSKTPDADLRDSRHSTRDSHRGPADGRRPSPPRSPRPSRSDDVSRTSTRQPSPSSNPPRQARRQPGPNPRDPAYDDHYRGSRAGSPRRDARPRDASVDRYMPSRPDANDEFPPVRRDPLVEEPPVDRYMSSRRPEYQDELVPRDRYREGDGHSYLQKPPYHDDRSGYGRSPPYTRPYRDSPSHSPYSSGRGGWSNHQHPPESQYPPQHSSGDRSYGPSSGPPGQYPPRSEGPPTGPRDPQGGFRGARSNGLRGSFSGPQYAPSGDRDTGHKGPTDRGYDKGEPHRPIRDVPNREAQKKDANEAESQDQAPGRAPPTGPAADSGSSSKFSFAFKASSKPPPATAPKMDISDKFNAPSAPASVPASSTQDHAPPRSAPTGPASGRDSRIPDGPRIAPRMRKVKKMMKRPKPRPTLSADLAASESVFHRKPGNESVVGSGTYGKVFKGLNVYTKGQVALKRIRMEGERDGFPVTAVREIKLLQSLRHANIVNLQEVMVEKNDCFMVFEYLSHDLTGLLNHPTFKLRDDQRKHLSKQMFEGLDYLHTRGVLHRDIKAANILVSKEGVLKLADFGLARFYAKRHQLDYTNRVITIWYRSPELLLGETKYTAAVDIWSAACVMVEIFDRTAIFPGDGTELNQLTKIYDVLGTPNRQDWPGLVDMAWFELLRPSAKKRNVFADRYKEKVSKSAFDLLEAMFLYDPAKRPTAGQVLKHSYFTTEEPLPQQAVDFAGIDGEWHEFESKALRKENERKAREARKASEAAAKDKKRGAENQNLEPQRDAKRVHVDKAVEHAPAAA